LHIHLSYIYVHDKVNFKLVQGLAALSVASPDLHDADIDIASPSDQLVVYHILHQMRLVNLPEVESGVPEPDICCIVLLRILKVALAAHIVPVRL
jgi:hypothetical protein